MDSYADHMFPPKVRAEQDRIGMGTRFADMYKTRLRGPLDEDAQAFIQTRDSFYLATVSETGWPYVQHRGGSPGFLRVLGPERIGFGDYVGNRQFISKGNLQHDTRVSLILMDYPRKGRLKIIGHAHVADADTDPELLAQLSQNGAPAPERLVTIDIVAIDWNCQKYITPRFTNDELAQMIGPKLTAQEARIALLEAKLDARAPGWRNDD